MGNYNFELNLQEVNTMSYIDAYISEGSRVLEFGAANGRLTKYLADKKSCQVTVVEIDDQAGAEAANYAYKAFVGPEQGDINKFIWYDSDERYDYIIFADVLEHLPEPEPVLELCRDMLAEGGRILVSIPNIAHNSVLIGLFNDDFTYDEVGLLDKTHIHFFTYKTFQRMLEQLDLVICDQKPIYSSVGWNEIDNKYTDVPGEVEAALRKRKAGSIYQYVFCIGKKTAQNQYGKTFEEIAGYEPEYVKSEEASCFLYYSEDSHGPDKRIGQTYREEGRIQLVFECGEPICKIRFDVMECRALIQLESIILEGCDVTIPCNEILKHNAELEVGNVLCFNSRDPWLEVLVPDELKRVDRVTVSFRVLASRFEDGLFEMLAHIMEEARKSGIQYRFDEELRQLSDYAKHLEKDIAMQKEYSAHLEKDIATQKEYSAHLVKDIDIQKAYIAHLENDIKALKEYIDKMNNSTFWR